MSMVLCKAVGDWRWNRNVKLATYRFTAVKVMESNICVHKFTLTPNLHGWIFNFKREMEASEGQMTTLGLSEKHVNRRPSTSK